MDQTFLRKTALFLFLFFISLSGAVFAQEKPGNGDSLTLNLDKTDIRALIETMSKISGKNFIVDPRVSGEVTVISSASVTPDEAYEIFVSVLRVHGYSIVPSGSVYKVIPNLNAKQDGVPRVEERNFSDELINRVIRINHTQATQLIPILRPLLPKDAHIAAHPTSNTLLITDTAANTNRILELVESMDVKQDSDIEIVRLTNSQASELVKIIEQVQKKNTQKNEPFLNINSVTADNRTNSIVLNGSLNWRKDVKRLIVQLDLPADKNDDTQVIFLKHADAKDMLEVIKDIGQHKVKLQTKGQATQLSPGQLFDVQADEAANALILSASPMVARSIKSVIERLDIRRAQVHIQAIIAEVSHEKGVELGIEWATAPETDTGLIGHVTTPLTNSATSSITSYPGAIGKGISLGYLTNGTLTGLIKAFANDGDTNILSTPSLVTLDNEEASIIVGQNIPVVTGRYSGTSDTDTGVNPFQTIEREDVGIKLKVKPNINEGDTIKLNIEQEVSSVSQQNVDGIETNIREIKTTVIVDDAELIVLGGLMRDEISDAVSKVPFLGDIPVVGNLFKSRKSEKQKRNLMIFLVPRIIRDNDDIQTVTRKEYQKIRDSQLKAQEIGITLLDENLSPLLPETPMLLDTPPVSNIQDKAQ